MARKVQLVAVKWRDSPPLSFYTDPIFIPLILNHGYLIYTSILHPPLQFVDYYDSVGTVLMLPSLPLSSSSFYLRVSPLSILTVLLPLFLPLFFSSSSYTFLASFPGPAQLSITCSSFMRGESLGTRLILSID